MESSHDPGAILVFGFLIGWFTCYCMFLKAKEERKK